MKTPVRLLVFLAVLVCSSCDAIEVGWRPPLIPLRISVNNRGEVNLGMSSSVATLIGTFDLGGSTTIYSLRGERDTRRLLIRVNNKVTVYTLKSGETFKIQFAEEGVLYRKVALKYEDDGDIVLELESVGGSVDSSNPINVTMRFNNLIYAGRDYSPPDDCFTISLSVDGGRVQVFTGDAQFSTALAPGEHRWEASIHECYHGGLASPIVIPHTGNGSFEVYADTNFWLEAGWNGVPFFPTRYVRLVEDSAP